MIPYWKQFNQLSEEEKTLFFNYYVETNNKKRNDFFLHQNLDSFYLKKQKELLALALEDEYNRGHKSHLPAIKWLRGEQEYSEKTIEYNDILCYVVKDFETACVDYLKKDWL